jgi:hypothetical protein
MSPRLQLMLTDESAQAALGGRALLAFNLEHITLDGASYAVNSAAVDLDLVTHERRLLLSVTAEKLKEATHART